MLTSYMCGMGSVGVNYYVYIMCPTSYIIGDMGGKKHHCLCFNLQLLSFSYTKTKATLCFSESFMICFLLTVSIIF